MNNFSSLTRRDALKAAGTFGALALAGTGTLGALGAAEAAKKPIRIGVVSAAIKGKPQPRNGHIWHFAQGLHPVCDLDALKKHYPYGYGCSAITCAIPSSTLISSRFPTRASRTTTMPTRQWRCRSPRCFPE